MVDSWLAGTDPGWTGLTVQIKPAVRAYILARDGFSCVECGWSEVHPVDGLPLVEVDHIDGDAMNCRPENLRTLCPNHHAMTLTYRNRNMGSARTRG